MFARQLRFGRIPGIGAVAICALAAGWTAGQRSLFVAGHREKSSSLPLAPERDSRGPASPNDETRSNEADLAKLHHDSHEECFIANSVLTEVVVEPTLTSGA